MSAATLREALVAGLRRDGFLRDPAIERAFLRVPREQFLPDVELTEVYRDAAILIKEEGGVGLSSSSQPAMMAIMLEMLDIHPGQRVLEIGAGSGYNAAILGELVGDTGRVVTVELDPEVATWARERLTAAGYPTVAVQQADGVDGWHEGAPWDRVIVTVGTGDIAPAWVDQLCDGGILVLPLGIGPAQAVIAFERRGERLVSRSAEAAGFIRIRGQLADRWRPVEIAPGISTLTDQPLAALDRLSVLLRTTPTIESWPGTLHDGLFVTSILAGVPVVALWSTNAKASFFGPAFGRIDPEGRGMALIAQDSGRARLLLYGDVVAAELLRIDHDHWRMAGAPSLHDLHFAAWPRGRAPQSGPGRVTFDLPHWTLIVDWPTE